MRALDKLNTIVDEMKQAKRELWQMISTKDPALKKLLEEVNKRFGKPESVKDNFKEDSK